MESLGYRERLQNAIEFIEDHLADDLSLHDVSRQANTSLCHSHRLFRAFVGFSTMGAFAYFGKYVQDETSMNLVLVGCVLSVYGIGTAIGGRLAGRIRASLGDWFFLLAAGLGGGAALAIFGLARPMQLVAVLALLIYGLAFICIQSSVISSAQELMPNRRVRVMSAASFTMVLNGG
jgi:predicted MFS family arabinose efflux permease